MYFILKNENENEYVEGLCDIDIMEFQLNRVGKNSNALLKFEIDQVFTSPSGVQYKVSSLKDRRVWTLSYVVDDKIVEAVEALSQVDTECNKWWQPAASRFDHAKRKTAGMLIVLLEFSIYYIIIPMHPTMISLLMPLLLFIEMATLKWYFFKTIAISMLKTSSWPAVISDQKYSRIFMFNIVMYAYLTALDIYRSYDTIWFVATLTLDILVIFPIIMVLLISIKYFGMNSEKIGKSLVVVGSEKCSHNDIDRQIFNDKIDALVLRACKQEQNIYIQGSKQCDKCAYHDASVLGLTIVTNYDMKI
jgi:hypothetical protein